MINFVKYLKTFFGLILISSFLVIQVVNAEDNTEKAILIERYLIWHKENIIEYAKKYDFDNDKQVVDGLAKIDNLIDSLQKIQNHNTWKEEKAISIILEELKKANAYLESILKIKKEDYDRKLQVQKEVYNNLWKKLWDQLTKIHSTFSVIVKNKTNLTEEEQKLKNTLEIIDLLSRDVKGFWARKFDTIEEMQSSFLWTISSIKYYILVLKNLKI